MRACVWMSKSVFVHVTWMFGFVYSLFNIGGNVVAGTVPSTVSSLTALR